MAPVPPRARDFVLRHLDGFDDEALRTFLVPGEAGVDPTLLGRALQGTDAGGLAARVVAALPPAARRACVAGRTAPASATSVRRARRHVVERLFWALLYWHDPQGYEELVEGEAINPRLLEVVPVDGREVADLGAGAGRFTLWAAERAARVVAVDAVPALLGRLETRVRQAGLANVETRRGGFLDLPLPDAAVDVAVACSSLTSQAPWGGERALSEAERVVRPGGRLVVIWPDDPDWFVARGFTHLRVPTAPEWAVLRFADCATAERICRAFYGEEAAAWVRERGASAVPFSVLGVRPPSEACVKRLPGAP